jgi:hypothetical protein
MIGACHLNSVSIKVFAVGNITKPLLYLSSAFSLFFLFPAPVLGAALANLIAFLCNYKRLIVALPGFLRRIYAVNIFPVT